MAVITKYVVVRNGVELDLVFEIKKEADAYDKMLDAADNLSRFIRESDLEIDLDDKIIDGISVLLSKNGPEVMKILKGINSTPSLKSRSMEKTAPSAPGEKDDKNPKKPPKGPKRS